MPAKSKSQQRFFGMIDAYKKGKLKNAPNKIRDAAKHVSDEDARDFAKTKHDGLPEKVEEKSAAFVAGFLHKCASAGIDIDTAGELYKKALSLFGSKSPEDEAYEKWRAERFGPEAIARSERIAAESRARLNASLAEARARGIDRGMVTSYNAARDRGFSPVSAYREMNRTAGRSGLTPDQERQVAQERTRRAEYEDWWKRVGNKNQLQHLKRQGFKGGIDEWKALDNAKKRQYVQNAFNRQRESDWFKGLSNAERRQIASANGWGGEGKVKHDVIAKAYAARNNPMSTAQTVVTQQPATQPSAPKTYTVPKPTASNQPASKPSATTGGADFWADNTLRSNPAVQPKPIVGQTQPVKTTTPVAGSPVAPKQPSIKIPSKTKAVSGYNKLMPNRAGLI